MLRFFGESDLARKKELRYFLGNSFRVVTPTRILDSFLKKIKHSSFENLHQFCMQNALLPISARRMAAGGRR